MGGEREKENLRSKSKNIDNVPFIDFYSKPARVRSTFTSPTVSLFAEEDRSTYFSLSFFLLKSFLFSIFAIYIEEI